MGSVSSFYLSWYFQGRIFVTIDISEVLLAKRWSLVEMAEGRISAQLQQQHLNPSPHTPPTQGSHPGSFSGKAEGGEGPRASGDPTLLEAEWYWGDITRCVKVDNGFYSGLSTMPPLSERK